MKKLILLFFLTLCLYNYGQNKSESKLITKIEKQILSKNILKKEYIKEIGWHGGYEKITLYLKNDIPILIIKEEKEVVHQYLTDGTEEDEIRFINARFYFLNWRKNSFIRIGNLTTRTKDSDDSIVIMPNNYIFEFDRKEIETIINGI